MRIHSLKLRGIGPFEQEQYVDVDEVGEQGLFLLDGPTGVGKSTIVDAIVFALFGTPATEGGQDRMVSDFLGEDVQKAARPFVELTFSVPAGVYRIHREPKAPYIKRTGAAGEHNATVHLRRLSGETDTGPGDLVSSRADEVGHEVLSLLGLDRDQVLSTMVLAQGQFATFLRAKSEDRRAILQSVFNTAPYERLQYALKDARAAAKEQQRTALESFRTAVEVFLAEAEWEQDAEAFVEAYRADPGAQQAALTDRIAQLRTALLEVTEELDRSEKQSAAASEALRRGQQTDSLAREKRELKTQLADLKSRLGEMTATRTAIEKARRAAVLDHPYATLDERRRELAAAQQEARSLSDLLPAAERGLSAEDMAPVISTVITQLAGIEAGLRAEADLPGMTADLTRLDREITELSESIDRRSAALAALPQKIATLESDLAEATRVAAGSAVAEEQRERAAQLAELLAEVTSLAATVEAATRRAGEADQTAKAAEESLSEIRRRYRDGIAAELAEMLTDGEPCPVCGSASHPLPAARGTDHVSAEDVEAREAAWRRLDTAARRAQQDLTESAISLHSKRDALGDHDRDSITQAQQTAAEQVARADRADKDRIRLGEELQQQRAAAEELSETISDERQSLAAKEQDRSNRQDRLAELTQLVAAAREGFDTVAARADHLGRRKDLLESAQRARRSEETAQSALATAQQAFQTALDESSFTDQAEFLGCRQTPAWIDEQEERVDQHDRQLHSVRTSLASDRLRDVDESVVIDLDALDEAAAAAKSAADSCRGRRANAEKALADASAAATTVERAWRHLTDVQEKTAPIIRLAALAGGESQNLHKITLATYVVMRRFADVVAAANSHLAEMSDGRYSLQTAQSSGSERRMGLGLNVYDDRTDAPRAPATLSGGETFYVSLALALGLADVVQSESGGVSLETLFIDEGFGALDSETLDTVMNVLTRLGRGHRTIGLISHVDELKRRVPDRVEIHRPDPNGPSQVKTRR